MTRKSYTRTERETAAEILACMASARANGDDVTLEELTQHEPNAITDLVYDAFGAVPSWDEQGDELRPFCDQYAEAESWVRSGWQPGAW